jgi:hypothetical protein
MKSRPYSLHRGKREHSAGRKTGSAGALVVGDLPREFEFAAISIRQTEVGIGGQTSVSIGVFSREIPAIIFNHCNHLRVQTGF